MEYEEEVDREMMHSPHSRVAAVNKARALGVLLVALLAVSAAAATASGKAFAWGYYEYGQLGNGVFGTDSDVPVAVMYLTNIDGGYAFILATTQ